MIRKFLVGGAAAMAVLMTLGGCTATTVTVDDERVEEQIRTNIGPQLPAPIDEVDCPEDLKGEVGQKMVCTITVQGQQMQIEVTVTSVEGNNVNFDMKGV